MSWQNYKWAWTLRGVTPSEQLICLYMADQANGEGVIEKLSHKKVVQRCPGLSYRRVREIIRVLHKDKKLIKERKPRFMQRQHSQISNGYQLDFKAHHPPDPIGEKLWQETIEGIRAKEKTAHEALRIHALESSAYYTDELKTLSVWLDSRRSYAFFEARSLALVEDSQHFNPRVYHYEFISPE